MNRKYALDKGQVVRLIDGGGDEESSRVGREGV